MAALVEQLETRVGSVDNGEVYMKQTTNAVVPMPEGPKIFETVGPWEDFATPSRDMRLIIAMNVLAGLPQRIVQHPELFVLGGRKPAEAQQEIEDPARQADQASGRIEYKRTDGSSQRLTVADMHRPQGGLRDGLQPQRLRGAALGRPRWHPRDADLPAPRPRRPARPHGAIPHLVPRRPPPPALSRARPLRRIVSFLMMIGVLGRLPLGSAGSFSTRVIFLISVDLLAGAEHACGGRPGGGWAAR